MQTEREEKIIQHMLDEQQTETALTALCKAADTDGNGRIGLEEWHEAFDALTHHSFFDTLGLRSHDVAEFFTILVNRSEDQQASIKEFVKGCLRLRGTASCFDSLAILTDLQGLRQETLQMHNELKDAIKKAAK